MKAAPKGMYIFTSGWLSAIKQAVNQAGPAISNANCDGVRWNARWADIEATPNNYTWQYLDDAVAWAATNNKTCGIHINAGMDCPAWLYEAPYNAQSYTLVDTGAKIPVPGDTVFMTRWQKFVTDFGTRYNNNPTVTHIIIGGIGNHDEWDIATGLQDTAALGSTIEKVNAWKSSSKQIIDFYMSAFPSTTVMGYPVPPFNPSNAAEDPITSMREVSDYAANTYHCQFAYSIAPLQSSTTTSNSISANELFLHWTTNPTHGETLYPASSADDFNATLHVAIDLQIRGMEIYRVDFQNATLQNFVVSSGPYVGEAGGITPPRVDMLAIPDPTPCSAMPTATPTPTISPTPSPTPTPTPTSNQSPVVKAGPDQTVATHGTTLSGSATDDGIPNPPGILSYQWTKLSGPGTVTFGSGGSLKTSAIFSSGGVYTIQLSVSDGTLTGADTVVLTVNKYPIVNTGHDQTITLPSPATLSGSATDDGIPNPPGALKYTWSKITGPGTVSFANTNSAATTAIFSASGIYTLKLAASDSVFTGTDTVLVTVNPSTAPTADLKVTVTDDKTAIAAGTQNTYTITVTNAGPSAITGASVTDTFPNIFTGVTFTAIETGGATGFTASGTGNINDTVNMPDGSKITYTAKGKRSSASNGSVSNTARATAPDGILDLYTANNTAIDSDSITFKADLKVTVTDGKTSAVAGTNDTYTMVVTNLGPSDAAGVVIQDAFPATFTGVAFTATQTDGATGFAASGIGDVAQTVAMPSGSHITYKATGTISASATSSISNTATVSVPTEVIDPNTGNNTATDTDTL
jgi:uncharacterized repeat protein (TIGR01451 family)